MLKRYLTGAVAIAVAAAWTASAMAGAAIFGSGQGVTKTARPLDQEAFESAQKALADAAKPFGEQKPKLYVFMENTGRPLAIREALKKAGDVPVVGVSTGGYEPLGAVAFPKDKEQATITVLAIGGDVEVQTAVVEDAKMPVKDWEWVNQKADGQPWPAEKIKQQRDQSMAQHIAWGQALARQFKPVEGKTNVFMQLGCQHVPRMTWITQGTASVLPKSTHFIGIAAADHGSVWASASDNKGDRLLGILISGDFKAASAGTAGDMPDPTQYLYWREKIEAVQKELGGKPDCAILVGCAGWHNQLEEKHKITVDLLGGSAIFGAFGGGEIGHYQTGAPVTAAAGHYFVLGMKNK